MEKLKTQIEQIKKKVFEGRMHGGISPTYGKVLYEEIDKALSLYNVVGQSEQLVCESCGYEINPAGICINMNCSTN